MKSIVFDRIGKPLDVLEFREIPLPEIRENEVLVKMVWSSINPGDFLFIQDLYPEPKKPHFPGQIAGNAGAGVVERVGKNVSIKPGSLVAFYYFNSWAEYASIPEEWLIPLPAGLSFEKASQFHNAITAWDVLEESNLRAGEWLALTAGNSSVATQVLQFAKLRNVNVVSIVREAQQHTDLKALGASEVIELARVGTGLKDNLREITQSKGLSGVIDCVGGPPLEELIQSMVSWGGQIVIYGGYSPNKFELHNFDILMRGVTIKPYAYRYFFAPPKPEDFPELSKIAEVFSQSDFTVSVGGTHALEGYKAAIAETVSHPERGKQFFKICEP